MNPRISAIICAYTCDRWDDLGEAVASIRGQTLPPAEIVLVIDHNPELLARAAAAFPDLTVVSNREERGLSGARNTGIAVSGCPLLVFFDDDAVGDPDFLLHLARQCEAPEVLGAVAKIEPQWIAARPSWLPDEFLWTVGCSYRGLPATASEVRNLLGAAMMLKRQVFAAAGPFSGAVGRRGGSVPLSCEETELCIRAKGFFPDGRFVFEPAAVVRHKIPAGRLTWRYFSVRCYAEGLSKAYVAALSNNRDALSTETGYVTRTLSRGILRNLAGALTLMSSAGLQRAAAILLGLACASAGFVVGTIRSPVRKGGGPSSARYAPKPEHEQGAAMRILLLSQFYPPIIGGEERHVRNLATALAARGHHVAVATIGSGGQPRLEQDGEIRVYRLRSAAQRIPGLFLDPERSHAPPFPDPVLAAGLARVVAKERPDIVHAHNWIFYSYLPLKRRSPARFVVTLHDYSLRCVKKNAMYEGKPCSGPALRKCLGCAVAHYGTTKGWVTVLASRLAGGMVRRSVDLFLAVSRPVAEFNRLNEAAAVKVIHNFVPDDVAVLDAAVDPCLSELPEAAYILFVGDLCHLKGADVLVEAYGKLDGAPPLVLIGRQCPDAPKALPPNVHVFRDWPHAAIMHAWSRCLFGVLPSVGREACATVVMEAMSMGKPMVATDVGGMPELIDHGRTGLLVAPDDADALAAAMRTLVADPVLYRRFAAASLEKVEALKAAAIVSQIEAAYRDLTTNG
jgi:glycosyltransferase involved in cell wall biosynthesis/GT2 family glycosyltransferase